MFKGSLPALVTPFSNGQVDVDALKKLVNWHVDQGSHGLVPVGTTGESPTNVIKVELRFTCFGDTEWETDVFPTTFEYISLTDKVSDSFYNTWNRTE